LGLLLSLITSQVFGQPANWEKNWRGGARINALDIEHGSIGELSHVVASGWERFASNMPGLLLIIGLLGTFLGLGLALDKASTILQGLLSEGVKNCRISPIMPQPQSL
jgi:hypothetical protein